MMAEPEVVSLQHNQFAYSVSEISTALKRVVEDNFGQVRVRGEISGWKLASSGHAYLKLKDANAVLDAVCWKGIVSKLPFRPEDGIEVICSGKITTYPGRSNYQIVIDFMEPAGAGALMALLEKRKKMLAAEGLFDEKRKKPLPFMPQVIGVVTSPTGAVIRDILHRLSDRFACHVVVWPVAVQGEGAAEQVARAVEGFNKYGIQIAGNGFQVNLCEGAEQGADLFSGNGIAPTSIKPDLIIVARGGGSLEDLWAFNEEVVVRAVAASAIPVISAVGHETDTTLIDYVSDRRAPTPTAAAEMAVPVRAELILAINELEKRISVAALRTVQVREDRVSGLARGLPNPVVLLETATQRLDDWSERLAGALPASLNGKNQQLAVAAAKLQPGNLLTHIKNDTAKLEEAGGRMARLMLRGIEDRESKLEAMGKLLNSLDYKSVLERGFAVVRNENGQVITRAAALQQQEKLELEFFDGIKTIANCVIREN
ncbi:MAG TPA: exodeoxyribonuclease VII large subunit [Rickettsiales bacterium]|nr:exodeoxyribonuclease VII large subunit [Rickettsiales bacterium]